MIVLDGTSLTCADVTAVGRRQAEVEIGAAGRARAGAAAMTARALTARRCRLRSDDWRRRQQGRADWPRRRGGDRAPARPQPRKRRRTADRARGEPCRTGGAGQPDRRGRLRRRPRCARRARRLREPRPRPPARRYDAIGTGDLAALAVTALCLLGERDWLAAEDAPAEDMGAPQPDSAWTRRTCSRSCPATR